MEERILSLCKTLNAALKNDNNFLLLNKLENELNNNDEIMKLSYKKDIACSKYSDLLKIYKEDNEEVLKAQKELNNAKKELDSHPIVKEYLKAYAEVKKILFEVNKILFSDYLNKECR